MGNKCKHCGYEKEAHEVIETLNDNEDGYEQWYVCPIRQYFEEEDSS